MNLQVEFCSNVFRNTKKSFGQIQFQLANDKIFLFKESQNFVNCKSERKKKTFLSIYLSIKCFDSISLVQRINWQKFFLVTFNFVFLCLKIFYLNYSFLSFYFSFFFHQKGEEEEEESFTFNKVNTQISWKNYNLKLTVFPRS